MGGSSRHTELARLIGAVDMPAGGIWIAYIKQVLRAGQLVAAVPVTGSLVCFSWFNVRNTTDTVSFPRRRTLGDTDRVNWAEFQVWLQAIAGDCNMDADSLVIDDREGDTFGMDLSVPWDAPEAVVDVSSASVLPLRDLPDGMGLVGHQKDATESRILQGRDPRSIRVLVPDRRGFNQNFHDVTIVDNRGGGGGDLLDYIGPKLGVTPLLDPGTDLDNELPSPDVSPMVINHRVALLPAQVEEDVDLAQMLVEFGTLPAIVTPIHDPQEARVMPPAEYRPLEAPADVFVAPADDDRRLRRCRRWRGTCFSQDRRGLVHHLGQSPFRITSYDLEIDGSDFSPEYGVQLHDPRLLEYVGTPESARLLSRSPEYWVQHMGREKTLSAALQLQHDVGLILSNVQLVTALHGASANVMGAVRGHQLFPTHAMKHALPSCRVRRAAHYMTAMGLWRPPVAPGIRGPLPVAMCTTCMSCGDCFPEVPL